MTKCPARIHIAGFEYRCQNEDIPHRGAPRRHWARQHGDEDICYWSQDVTPPERQWQPGDVVRDAQGFLFTHRGSSYTEQWAHGDAWVHDRRLTRPLTHLVPAPKPVDLDEVAQVLEDCGVYPTKARVIARAVCDHLGLEVAGDSRD